ncbi:MAG: molybdopterin converting factor subunit 1 [Acidobacteria bacterium]|nr:molybdopterin converting factor subunit 1 [Acidobacteriota bacterium]
MQVKVLFFGQLKDLVGRAEDQVELPAGASVADLVSYYQERVPRWDEFRPSIAVAVNQEYADAAVPLRGGDEVAFIPPVSGGANSDRVELTRAPIAREELVAAIKAPPDGAVVIFEGIVRNHSAGRQTLYLDYEAYEAMALAKMRALAAELHQQFAIDRLVMVHRLGRLEIGETSVLIAVSSAHRAAAFDACRAAIDLLKRTVPIWKKEYFADGAVWAEGEFPAAAALPATPSQAKP